MAQLPEAFKAVGVEMFDDVRSVVASSGVVISFGDDIDTEKAGVSVIKLPNVFKTL